MKRTENPTVPGLISGTFFFILLGLMTLLGEGKQSAALAVGSVGILGLYSFSHRREVEESRAVIVLFGLFAVSLCIASVSSISPGYTISEINRYLVGLLVYLYFSQHKKEITPAVFSGLLLRWTAFLLSAASLVFLFPALQKVLPAMNLLHRVYGHNQISYVLIFALPAAAHYFTRGGRFSAPLLLGLLGALIASYSRGAILLAGLYGTYVLLFKIRPELLRTHGDKTTGKTVAVFGIFFIAAAIMMISGNSLSGRFRLFKEPVLASRVYYWKEAAVAIKKKPLTGWGPGSFYLLSKTFQAEPLTYSWFAHSFPLQTAAEVGIPGAVLLLVLIGVLIRRARRNTSGQNESAQVSRALLEGVFLILIYSGIDISLDFTVVWMLLWAALGLLAGYDGMPVQAGRVWPAIITTARVVTGLCYLTVMISGIIKVTPFSAASFFAAPHIADNSIDYLLNIKVPPPSVVEKIITALHGSNPEVLYVLAANSEKPDPSKSLRYYHDAMVRDPYNGVYAGRFIQLLFLQKQSIPEEALTGTAASLYYALRSGRPGYRKTVIESISRAEYDYESSYISSLRAVSSGNPSYFYSKLYYLWGLHEEARNPDVSTHLLQYAAELSPRWSYFHLEMASYFFYVRQDRVQAQAALDRCSTIEDAGSHCSEFTVDTLREPGYYQDLIVNIQ